jgi:hypothetical protein
MAKKSHWVFDSSKYKMVGVFGDAVHQKFILRPRAAFQFTVPANG